MKNLAKKLKKDLTGFFVFFVIFNDASQISVFFNTGVYLGGLVKLFL